jgi:hypothetical protein
VASRSRQTRRGEPDRLFALALAAAAAVLLLGERAQEPVLAARRLRLERGDASLHISLGFGSGRIVRITRRARFSVWSIWAHQLVSS